jgi:hypothetical protein
MAIFPFHQGEVEIRISIPTSKSLMRASEHEFIRIDELCPWKISMFAEHLSSNPEFESRNRVNGWTGCKECMTAPMHGSCHFFCTGLPFLTPPPSTPTLPPSSRNCTHLCVISQTVNVGLEFFFHI